VNQGVVTERRPGVESWQAVSWTVRRLDRPARSKIPGWDARPDPKRARASIDDRQQGWETGRGAGTKVRAEVTWGFAHVAVFVV